MKSNKMFNCTVVIGLVCWSVSTCGAQTPPPNISPDLQEVVKLFQAHTSDEVIMNYIRSSGKSYRLGAEDIVYLTSQGVSQVVISALQTTSSSVAPQAAPVAPQVAPMAPPGPVPPGPAPVMAPAPAGPPEGGPQVTIEYFHAQLQPFGTWVEVPGYGMCWRPDSAIRANPDWRPYYDMGQWVQTENGLFWRSEVRLGGHPVPLRALGNNPRPGLVLGS